MPAAPLDMQGTKGDRMLKAMPVLSDTAACPSTCAQEGMRAKKGAFV